VGARLSPSPETEASAGEFTTVSVQPSTVFHPNPTPHARYLRSVEGMTFRSRQIERAVTQGTPSDALSICVGPPGTGKTHALLDALELALARGQRCLVCAPTNVGVADLHARALKRGLRGHLALAKRHIPLESAFVRTPLSRSAVVFCTVCGRWGGALVDLEFDAVFLDEAARCMEARVVGMLSSVATAFLVGDPRQLPEQVSTEGEAQGYGRSLMVRLLGLGYPHALLTTQRRMHPDICLLPNRLFYNGTLRTCTEGRASSPHPHYAVVDVKLGKEARDGTSYFNDTEARLAAEVARVHVGVHDPLRVVVLVAYSAQQSRVYRHDPGCAVCTIDSFQGKEADVVVLCTTRTRAEGFWSDEARVNVALTRARDRLVVLMHHSRWAGEADSILGHLARDGTRRGVVWDDARAVADFGNEARAAADLGDKILAR
tara:strand:- start:2195 stop:3490 length:1296 start_codon:yes stop_codon:yes gene_type:complete